MRKTLTSALAASLLMLGALSVPTWSHAQQSASTVITVTFQGPGGHSNSNYGRTSAVHAASRAIAALTQANDVAPSDYSVYGFKGGNSVNSIASDAEFKVAVYANASAVEAAVESAAAAGSAAENDFRKVKEGDKVGGVPAAISYTIARD